MTTDELAMAHGNYGYGRWEATYWFIGPEQGMGLHEDNDLTLRVQAWLELGGPRSERLPRVPLSNS